MQFFSILFLFLYYSLTLFTWAGRHIQLFFHNPNTIPFHIMEYLMINSYIKYISVYTSFLSKSLVQDCTLLDWFNYGWHIWSYRFYRSNSMSCTHVTNSSNQTIIGLILLSVTKNLIFYLCSFFTFNVNYGHFGVCCWFGFVFFWV